MGSTWKPTPPRPVMRPTGRRPIGPIAPPIYTPASKQPTQPKVEPLVTEGMKAHRRDIERRRRAALAEKLRLEEDQIVRNQQIWKFVIWAVVVVLAWIGYRHVQNQYGNRWPLDIVWAVMSLILLTTLGWLIWYMNRDEI